MKKLLVTQIVLLSIVVAQVDLRSFIGEKLHYDLTIAGSKVAKIDIRVQHVDDSTISVSFNCETIRWAEPLFNEKDSIYTEIDLNKFQFTYSYRLTDWQILLFTPDVTEVFLSKDDSIMSYRHEEDAWFSYDNKVLLDETIIINDKVTTHNVNEVLSAGLFRRMNSAIVGDTLDLWVLGLEGEVVGPEVIPIRATVLDTLIVGSYMFETIKCRIAILDNNWLFSKPTLNVWITNDIYHIPLKGEVTVVDSIGLKVNIDLEKSIIPYWNDVKKQLIIK